MLFALVVGITMVPGVVVGQEVEGEDVKEEAEAFNPKETIFEHLSDEYWWTIAGKAVLPHLESLTNTGGYCHTGQKNARQQMSRQAYSMTYFQA